MGERILLVDDEESVLFAIHDYLTLRGHDVQRATDLETAERLLDEGRFTCVVTDLHLTPARTDEGFQVAVKARGTGVTRVVLLTARGTAEIERDAASRGIDHVIAKPVRLAALEDLLSAGTETRS
jgi:DNA-binding response OmpR family regulator